MLHDISIPDRRIAARFTVERPVSVGADSGDHDAVTVNVSTSGMLVALAGELLIWSDVTVNLPALGARQARVARRDGDRYGLVFREPLTAAEFAELTGVALPEADGDVPVTTPPRRAARTAPWAFGRDRLKTLKREAAQRADVDRRR